MELPSQKPIHIPLFLQNTPVNLETGVFVLCIAQLFVGIMMLSMATFVFNSCRAFYLQIFTTTCLSDLFQRADLFLRLHFCSQSSGISLVVFFFKPSFVAARQRHSQTSPLPSIFSALQLVWSNFSSQCEVRQILLMEWVLPFSFLNILIVTLAFLLN